MIIRTITINSSLNKHKKICCRTINKDNKEEIYIYINKYTISFNNLIKILVL